MTTRKTTRPPRAGPLGAGTVVPRPRAERPTPAGTGLVPRQQRVPAGPELPLAAAEGAAARGLQTPGVRGPRTTDSRAPGHQPRSWTIELPAGTPILTANHRMHRMAAGARTKALRGVAFQLARAARLPELERAEILVRYLPPPRLKRDRHPLASERIEDSENLQPTAKALVDGIVQAGVLPSDSRKYVRHVICEVLPGTHPRGQVTVTITEVLP